MFTFASENQVLAQDVKVGGENREDRRGTGNTAGGNLSLQQQKRGEDRTQKKKRSRRIGQEYDRHDLEIRANVNGCIRTKKTLRGEERKR